MQTGIIPPYIYFPFLDEMLYAIKGKGAYWKPQRRSEFVPAKVSTKTSLEDSVFCHSGREYFHKDCDQQTLNLLENKCALTRTWGDAYGHALVATGRADIHYDPKVALWDVVPLKIILEEAGGFFEGLDKSLGLHNHFALSHNGKMNLAEYIKR